MRRGWLLLLLGWAATSGMAAEYPLVQGGVTMFSVASEEPPSLHAFGVAWPVGAMGKGRWRGWVAADLAERPGRHAVDWRVDGRRVQRDWLVVAPRKVRISRIQVPRKMASFDAETLARIRREAQAIRHCWRKALALRARTIGFARMPVDPYQISTPFGAQRIVNRSPRAPHAGVDLAAPLGAPVVAPASGIVVLALDGYLVGKTLCVAHGDGLASVFMHLDRFDVSLGEQVQAGERLGAVGESGRATGPHLHWGVVFHGKRIDPMALVAAH